MITNKQISEAMIECVNTNTKIQEYCIKTFKQEPLIFLGIDIQNPPRETEYPALIFEPLKKEIARDSKELQYIFLIRVVIKGNDKPELTGNIARYAGVYQVEELGNLICDAVYNKLGCNTNLTIQECDFYQDEINVFPVYSGTVITVFTIENVIGWETQTII